MGSGTSRTGATLTALLLAGLAIRLWVAWQDIGWLIDVHPTHAFLIDDSFLSHGIARNLALGRGLTADGVHATNGFQPLYVFLLVPLYALLGGDRNLPVHLALCLLAVANVACGLLLFRIARRHAGAAAALFAVAVWCLAPDVVRLGINGLETSLATFWLLWALDHYLGRIRIPGSTDWRRFAWLGLLLGLAGLTRVDAILFAAAVGADLAWLAWRRGPRRDWLAGAAVTAALALAVVSPWVVFSVARFGTPMPESGRAVRFAALDRHAHRTPPGFYMTNIVESAAAILDNPALPGWRAWSGRPYHLPEPRAVGLNGPLFLLLVSWFAWRARRANREGASSSAAGEPARASPAHLGFLLLYAAMLVVAHAFWVLGQWFYPRYYYTLSALVVLVVALGVGSAFRALRVRAARIALATVLVVVLGSAWAREWRGLATLEGDCGYYALMRWVEQNVPTRLTVGAFQSGVLGYFLDHRVINLDGVVNAEALRALEHERAFDYVLHEHIDVIADWKWVVRVSLIENSRGTPPALEPQGEVCQFGVWRVLRLPATLP